MPAMSWAFLSTAVVALIAVAAAERVPREVTWTDDTFGPDGPWRAVNVQMGVDGAPLGLYPGSTWETWLIEDDYCDGATCYASKAGTYDKSSGDQGGILLDGGLSGFMLGLELEGHPGKRYMDDMSLNGITAESVSLVLLDSQNIKYPGGQTSPFFAGCLSLGGSGGTNQSFTGIDDAPAINKVRQIRVPFLHLNLTLTSPLVDKDGHSGMRTGIGIGITAAVLALGIGTFFFWRRNRASQSQKAAHTLASEAAYTATSTPKWPPGELDSQEMPPIEMPSLEMPSYYDRPELP